MRDLILPMQCQSKGIITDESMTKEYLVVNIFVYSGDVQGHKQACILPCLLLILA